MPVVYSIHTSFHFYSCKYERREDIYRTYHGYYLKYGFIEFPDSMQQPLCRFCLEIFLNDAMKPSKLNQHMKKRHKGNVGKPIECFQRPETATTNRGTLLNHLVQVVLQVII